jgi:hypothetical protein
LKSAANPALRDAVRRERIDAPPVEAGSIRSRAA